MARWAERIEALARELTDKDGKAVAVTTDVTSRAQVKALVDKAVDAHGRIDVMLNNAGLMPLERRERLKIDEWEQMIDVNLKGVLYGIAAALPHMKEQKSGHLINVSSVYGHKVAESAAVYCATKFAVRALSEGLRQEVKPYDIRTTVISPGAVATELLDHIREEGIARDVREHVTEIGLPPIPSPAWSRLRSASRRMSTSTRSCSGRPRNRPDRVLPALWPPRHYSDSLRAGAPDQTHQSGWASASAAAARPAATASS